MTANRQWIPRVPAGMRAVLIVALVALLVAGTAFVVRQTFFGPKTIVAYFSSATAIYPGDQVRVAGVPVGTIRSIEPQGTRARMTLAIDHDVPIPADAKAVIVAQNLVAARYVQLTPAYGSSEAPGGPTLSDGAEIGQDRTAVPVEWDQIKEQLTRLATDLGPRVRCRRRRWVASSTPPPTRWTVTGPGCGRRSRNSRVRAAFLPTAAATSSTS